MSEKALIDRLKWITEEHFRGKQTALAKAMCCGDPYVSGLFKGKRNNPGSELLENLISSLKAIGVNLNREWLRHGTGPIYSEDDTAFQLKEGPGPGDLSWIIQDHSEALLIERMNKHLNDQELTFETRVERAAIYFDELKRRATLEKTRSSERRVAAAVAAAVEEAAAGIAGAKPSVHE